MFKILLLAVMLAGSTANADVFEIENPKRALKLIGVVSGATLPLAGYIDQFSKKGEDIDMLINSPGGSVAVGMMIVDAMRAAKKRGTKFRCASAVMAASMAFIILAECDERYVLPNTRLLFHPVSIGTKCSRVQELIIDLDETIKEEKIIMRKLQRQMGLSWRGFHRHYFAETFWAGFRLAEHTARAGFLKVVKDMRGWDKDLFVYRRPKKLWKKTLPKHESDVVRKIIRRYERGQ